jgi:hypothetical protein
MSHHHHRKEPLWKELWRPLAAFVYLGICVLDFGVMPVIYEMINQSITNQQLVDLALKFKDAAAQIEALHTLRQARVWVPLTLQGNGMFHIAFGAILGVAAYTRGQEKTMMMNTGYPGFGGSYGGGYGGFPSQPYQQQQFGGYNNYGSQFGGHSHPYAPMSGAQPVNTQKTDAVSAGPKLDIVNPDDTNE